jgi:hypothetical protein
MALIAQSKGCTCKKQDRQCSRLRIQPEFQQVWLVKDRYLNAIRGIFYPITILDGAFMQLGG